nr:YqaJ-like viral recombinase [Oceanusvirus sp.]
MDMDRTVEAAMRLSKEPSRVTTKAIAKRISLLTQKPVPVGLIKKRHDEILAYREQLERLLKNPGIPQRTPEWYAARENMVTGSELYNAMEGRKQFFEGKLAGPESWNALKDNPAIKWGVLYEPVATAIYERRTGATVHEFGLIPHESIRGFGASPDGISELGIMLEIKCPYSRQITGEVPRAYAAQIQAQLDTCGLRECDFLECKLEEYQDAAAFRADTHPQDPRLSRDGTEKGAVWLSDGAHEVSPDEDADGVLAWADERPGAKLWKLVFLSCARVKKDDAYIREIAPKIERAVDRIAKYRRDPDAFSKDFGELKGFSFIM